jgi:antirestriction protein ArdC
MTDRRDLRQEVTDKIVALLEQGVAPWQKPWNPENSFFQMPLNPTTGKEYRGGNALHLLAEQTVRGFEDPRWMTYRQAGEHGWQVRKGEKGTAIEYWKFPTPQETREAEAAGDPPPAPLQKVFRVFNAQQIEGIPAYEPRVRPEWEVVQSGEAIVAASGAKLLHDQQNRAFYSRTEDTIHLPSKSAFPTPTAYYGTALHELAHWSGHPERLNRQTLNESYREE